MSLVVYLPKSYSRPTGKDPCGFFFDFGICDTDDPDVGPFPCAGEMIWDGCTQNFKWYCVRRRQRYQYWCVTV